MVTCMEKIVVLPLGTLLSLEDQFLRLRLALDVDEQGNVSQTEINFRCVVLFDAFFLVSIPCCELPTNCESFQIDSCRSLCTLELRYMHLFLGIGLYERSIRRKMLTSNIAQTTNIGLYKMMGFHNTTLLKSFFFAFCLMNRQLCWQNCASEEVQKKLCQEPRFVLWSLFCKK